MAVTADDVAWMRLALGEANRAAALGEVPIGAILVAAGLEIARGFNRTRTDADPTAHAEVVVLRDAAGRLMDARVGGTLYVTLEPCLMCMGALVQARISRLVFGAIDPKAGAAVSLYRIAEDERLNHRFAVDGGALADDCGRLLTEFFRGLRR
jgi:tRNA(adenine34) deaminase